jgi:hypothetical protein
MPQIQKGDTFADGQQVTGARLNQLVDSATILPAIITDQTNLTANTVATGDSVLLYDLSATALREATASDLLNSGIAITTSSVTGGSNSDITITPNDATIVSGATYTSGDGLTVVVTSNAHGLAVGQVVLISSAGTGYNGTFRLTAVTTNTFTYVMTTAATAGSGSLSFTRKGTVKNTANKAISGNLYVDGNAVITGTTINTGAVTNTGNVSVGGNLTVTGTTTASLTTTSTAVTQTSTDSSTKIATTAFVNSWNPIKAWVNFNGNGSTVGANLTINASFNVTNVVYEGTGVYSINFTNAISDVNYAIVANGQIGSTGGCPTVGLHTTGGVGNNPTTKTTTKVIIASVKDSTGANLNQSNISVMILR